MGPVPIHVSNETGPNTHVGCDRPKRNFRLWKPLTILNLSCIFVVDAKPHPTNRYEQSKYKTTDDRCIPHGHFLLSKSPPIPTDVFTTSEIHKQHKRIQLVFRLRGTNQATCGTPNDIFRILPTCGQNSCRKHVSLAKSCLFVRPRTLPALANIYHLAEPR